MRIRWSVRAKMDLVSIGRYIARDNHRAARAFVGRIQERMRKAGKTPHAGRVVPEFMRQDIREVILGNYRIIYAVGEKWIDVLTVLEGHRLLSP